MSFLLTALSMEPAVFGVFKQLLGEQQKSPLEPQEASILCTCLCTALLTLNVVFTPQILPGFHSNWQFPPPSLRTVQGHPLFCGEHQRVGAPLPRGGWKLLRNHTQLEIYPSENSGCTKLPKPPRFSEKMKGWVRVLLLHLGFNTSIHNERGCPNKLALRQRLLFDSFILNNGNKHR